MKLFKRSLAMLVALVMCVGMLSLNAFAADQKIDQNYCPKSQGSHSMVYRTKEEATTCKDGWSGGYYCEYCGWEKDGKVLPAPHAWDSGEVTKEATVDEEGEMTYHCTQCTKTKTESIGKLSPGPVETVCEHKDCVPATCEAPAFCRDCKQSVGEKNPNKHTKGTSWTEENGQHIEKYSCCGAMKSSHAAGQCPDTCPKKDTQTTEPTEHEHVRPEDYPYGWSQYIRPTCGKPGYYVYTCRDMECHKDFTVEIPATGAHQWDGEFRYQATGAQKESTCTVKGFETHLRRCTVCGTTETKTVDRDLLDHDWDDGVETKKPTCQEEGETTFTCSVCGETRTESIDKLTHGVDEDKDGNCDNCGESIDNGSQGGDNNQGGNNNQGGTTGGTTGGVTDPDPVDSGDGLTTIEEEEVPLAGLPFDLDATDELTRGLFAYIIYWFEGEPDAETSSFTDVAEDYEYAQAIAWGDANGILLGYGDGTYRPDNGITREEMVLILNRYANYKKAELVMEMDGDPYDVMLWVEAEEIVNDFFDRLSGEELPEGQEAA